jgi:hypothetical protein
LAGVGDGIAPVQSVDLILLIYIHNNLRFDRLAKAAGAAVAPTLATLGQGGTGRSITKT